MRQTLSQRALSFLDWFLSPELRAAPAHQLSRARVLAGCSLLIQATVSCGAIAIYLQGHPGYLALLCTVFVWGMVLPLLRFGYDRLAGIWVSTYGQLVMLFILLHRDAMYVLHDAWLGIVIMVGLYLAGTRFGALALALAILEQIFIPILGRHGLLIETPFLNEETSNALTNSVALFAIFALGWLYSSARDSANQALQTTLLTLSESREQYQLIAEGTDAVPFTYELSDRVFHYIGPQALRVFGWPLEQWSTSGFVDVVLPPEEVLKLRQAFAQARPGERMQLECSARSATGPMLAIRIIATVHADRGSRTVVGLMLDITELRRLEGKLRQAQKLESVGRLSSGVAHEINTPVQFVSDSVDFLREANRDLLALVVSLGTIRRSTLEGTPLQDAHAKAERAEDEADLPYLLDHMPAAFDRARDGLNRVATIVRSMKEFAHPDGRDMSVVDLNRAIESTLTIARHEYKQVADVETSFGQLPPVLCFAGEINQALLNLIVNASHALEDVMNATGRRGRIRVETKPEGGHVLIAISDTGDGIPDSIRERVFDPFFTTKPVGRGTGQGLSVARSVIVDKHGGELWFESESGKGTTFFIRLPVSGQAAAPMHPLPEARITVTSEGERC